MRDDFPLSVKRLLAERVGTRCSLCDQATMGPTDDPKGKMNVGVAAHITAASKDGPRFDPTLTSKQRKSAENGIWCCQNHGKMVDSDEGHYTVAWLKEEKAKAEARARKEIESPGENDVGALVPTPLELQVYAGLVHRYMIDDRRECLGLEFILRLFNPSATEERSVKFTSEIVQSPSDGSDVVVAARGGYWTVLPGEGQPKISQKAKPDQTLGYEEHWDVACVRMRLVRPFVRDLIIKITWGSEGKGQKKVELVAKAAALEALYKTADKSERGEMFVTGHAGFLSLFSPLPAGISLLKNEYHP